MPDTGSLTPDALLKLPDFLGVELCDRLRAEMSSGPTEAATMRYEGDTYKVDESRRRARRATVSEGAEARVRERLLAARERLSDHFGVRLTEPEELQFVIYREGDYIKRHADRARDVESGHPALGRLVSLVTSLNAASDEPGPETYGGGTLTFYRATDEGEEPIPVATDKDMLVAFRPELPHEVTPVTHGERFTIVSWYL
jgi:predicted 2-oxoglutarate/Fe(II)-dependent dioxygenase YbiX